MTRPEIILRLEWAPYQSYGRTERGNSIEFRSTSNGTSHGAQNPKHLVCSFVVWRLTLLKWTVPHVFVPHVFGIPRNLVGLMVLMVLF